MENHYKRLKEYLEYTNGSDLFKIYKNDPLISETVWEEYSPELQLDKLRKVKQKI